MTTTYERILDVISAAPADRDEKDIDILLPWFKRKTELFSSLANDVIRDIMKNCEFRRYVTDDVIIRQGDKGHCFFVVLNGSISIYIAADEDEPSPVANGDPAMPRDIRDELGACVRNLGPGTSFGELALIDPGSIRKASVVADEASDFIVVDRKLYSRSLKFAQKRDLDEKREFVEKHPLFKTWKARHKSILAMSLSRKRALFGNRLAQQGSAVTRVLFILRGQAKVTISPWKHPNRQILERQGGKLPKTASDVTEMKTNEVVSKAKSAANDGAIDICSIGPGDMIGDIELSCDVAEHMQTVTCLEAMEAFQLDLNSFHRLVAKRNPLTLDRMRIAAQLKLRGRAVRSQNESLVIFFELLLKKLSTTEAEPNPQEVMRTDLWMTQRGPIIDSLGPGSLYYRARRLDEKLRRRKEQRQLHINTVSQDQATASDAKSPPSNCFEPFTCNVEEHKEAQFLDLPKNRGVGNRAAFECQSKDAAAAMLPPSMNPEGREMNAGHLRSPRAIKWANRRKEKSDMQRSSPKGVTFEKKRDCTSQYQLQAPPLLPSFLHPNHCCVALSTRGSESMRRDGRARSGLASAPASYKITVGQDGATELQLLRRQYSADEYKSLKEKLRLQEKRHMRYLCSLW